MPGTRLVAGVAGRGLATHRALQQGPGSARRPGLLALLAAEVSNTPSHVRTIHHSHISCHMPIICDAHYQRRSSSRPAAPASSRCPCAAARPPRTPRGPGNDSGCPAGSQSAAGLGQQARPGRGVLAWRRFRAAAGSRLAGTVSCPRVIRSFCPPAASLMGFPVMVIMCLISYEICKLEGVRPVRRRAGSSKVAHLYQPASGPKSAASGKNG
jgi:hypothetical protein